MSVPRRQQVYDHRLVTANLLLGAPRTAPMASTRREKASITAPIQSGRTTPPTRVKSIIQM